MKSQLPYTQTILRGSFYSVLAMAIYSLISGPSTRAAWPVGNCSPAPPPRSPLRSYHGLVLSSIAGYFGYGGRKPRKCSALGAKGRTELLVDGDCHSTDDITRAIGCFEQHCKQKVNTTLFAAPQRCQNKKWKKFMRENGISFRPVQRRAGKVSAEPNDEAIIKALRKLSSFHDVRVGLLTMDTDFIGPILDLQDGGTDITVLIFSNRFGVQLDYKKQRVKVLSLAVQDKPRSGVRAILHPDGSGSVKLADPYVPVSSERNMSVSEEVSKFLQDLGYGDANGKFVDDRCIRFWFQNQLGQLTVFPPQMPLLTLHHLLSETEGGMTRNWEDCSGKLAYFLPVTATRGGLKKSEESIFGYVKARQVFKAAALSCWRILQTW